MFAGVSLCVCHVRGCLWRSDSPGAEVTGGHGCWGLNSVSLEEHQWSESCSCFSGPRKAILDGDWDGIGVGTSQERK